MYKAVIKGFYYITAVLTAALILIVFLNVFCRYVLGRSILWSEEGVRFLFVWCTFLGIVLANDRYEHMHLSLLADRLPRKHSAKVLLAANTAMLLISALLVWGGIIVSVESLDWLSPILDIPYGAVYAIAPVSCFLLCWQCIRRYPIILANRDQEV
jgi:TRAP-type C4-dicarboxylate transport system permease small subunit